MLCTAALSQDLPPWMKDDRAGGWVTAEYVMLPASTPQRKPWPKIGHTDSRGTEIQRLIGRAIRAAVDLSKIGPHTIALDCQVLQADGGNPHCLDLRRLCRARRCRPQTAGRNAQAHPGPSTGPSLPAGTPPSTTQAKRSSTNCRPFQSASSTAKSSSTSITRATRGRRST